MIDKTLQIKELLEVIYHFRKAILVIILIAFGLLILLIGIGVSIGNEDKLKETQIWNSIQTGDSIFVKDNVFYLDFYKKGREKLSDYEQKGINYRREDTLNFIEQNRIHEKYFYKSRTSFVGICIEKDSTITKQGEYNNHRWVKKKPSYEITHPPNTDKYDYDARKWEENSTDYFVNGNLSKEFFVNYDDITNINNDSIYNK